MIYSKYIPVGTKLYRFVDCKSFDEIQPGMTINAGLDGRFNKNQNVYYCSQGMDALLQKLDGTNVCGFLIESEVVRALRCAYPMDMVVRLAKRYNNEKKEPLRLILRSLGLNQDSCCDNASELFDLMTTVYRDGVVYPCIRIFDIDNIDSRFLLDKYTGFGSVALTENGYGKIKEKPPVVFWQNGR